MSRPWRAAPRHPCPVADRGAASHPECQASQLAVTCCDETGRVHGRQREDPNGRRPHLCGEDQWARRLLCGGAGGGVADSQPDGSVAEVGDQSRRPPRASTYRAMTSKEVTSPCSIWDTRATLTPIALAMPRCARPSCLRASANWCPRARASSSRAPGLDLAGGDETSAA